MKQRLWVVICVAACLTGLFGQMAALGATTNSTWSLTAISLFKVASLKVDKTNSVTAVFLSDGTCSLLMGTNEYAGSYTTTKNSVVLTPTAGGKAAIESDAVALIKAAIDDPAVTITASSLKFSKITLSKAGVPVKITDTIKGKGSATVKGKVKSKSFTLTTAWIDWTLTSGTNF
ncbi:MAG TPA: hypothetical protein VMP11_15675 [Verrucomicrobiae bacterium]|nr:hypothetical protein [Verrucomicrobiae bacterium]